MGAVAPSHDLYTYASRHELSVPSHAELRFGSTQTVVIDPRNYVVNAHVPWGGLAAGVASMLVGGITHSAGKTEILYGDEGHLAYGSRARNIRHGGVLSSVLKFPLVAPPEISTRVPQFLLAIHLASNGLGALFPALRAKSTSAAEADGFKTGERIAHTAAGLSQAALKLLEGTLGQTKSLVKTLTKASADLSMLSTLFQSADIAIINHGLDVARGLAPTWQS